ncbi:AlpA family transcriptional regulator [Pseudomonas sp. Choline-3u-10]|uniref:helix-turn-helix transcriptional regulator n=1 Tax=Pseudomonadaceae TaxID=135621 RepID=UPI000617BA2D|nr:MULTISPECIES: AlpA family transcriptional regulator [Pseudomonadaceae]MAL35834.1 AlpA family transcriptional regulator [Pseudomonas sp.]MBU0949146.1 AlpA family transcriptional regulator [Gammaproteobacteria bacterium]KJJ64842.1 AlpA family transcriptional regulator [Pseudomonas sp. 10B238]MBK3794009.1 AlpA family phage regulatory protein [Stutzerimonas stutzeri]MBK3875499.1 AlpA family phage regulatory protein [Stutzerimonas stutzeri]
MAAHTNPAQLPRRFIKLPKVKYYTSFSTSELYRRIAAGTFPKQIRLGPKSVAWDESEILAWCDEMAAQRGEAA